MRDVKTMLLILVSACLLGTWVFHIYDKSRYAVVTKLKPDITKNELQENDSIQILYKGMAAQLETVIIGKDSINKELHQKASEIDTLRIEINRMLNETNLTREDLRKALTKIQELQLKINQYNSSAGVVNANPQTTQSTVIATPKTQSNLAATEPSFVATDISIQAMKSAAGDNDASFAISFQIKNSNAVAGSTGIYVVVRDPQGNTVQDDEWIAGVFISKTEGTKKYSRRLNWEFNKNDSRKMTTTVPVKAFVDGTYQLQLYCNGIRLGKADVTLN